MATNMAWNLGEVPDDARDAALRCAMREGVPVGEWMTRQILKGFSELKVRDQAQMLEELNGQVAGLIGRLDRVADQSETEALREAVKRLHQALARIAGEMGEKANGSAAQVSELAVNLETLASKFETLRSDTVEAKNGLDARLAQTAGQLTIQISSLASNLEALAAKLSGTQSDVANTTAQLDQRLSEVQVDYDSAFAHHDEAARAIVGDLARLTDRVDETQNRARDATEGLGRRLEILQGELADLNARQNGAAQSISIELKALKSGLDEARAHEAETTEVLEHRLNAALQDIQNLEAGHGNAHRGLVERLEKIWEEAASTSAEARHAVEALRNDAAERDEALRRRLAMVDCAFADLNQRQTDATQSHERRFDAFASQLAAAQSERAEAADAVEQRFDRVLHEIQDTKSEHGETYQKLAERIEQIRSDAEQATVALANSFSAGQDEVKVLGTRHGETMQALEKKIEALHGISSGHEEIWTQRFADVDQSLVEIDQRLEARFELSQSRTEQSILTLDQQLNGVRKALNELDARESVTDEGLKSWSRHFADVDQSIAATNERLESKFQQVCSHTENSVATFDQQLKDIRKSLDERDARENAAKQELLGKLDSVIDQVSGSSAALDRQFAATCEQVEHQNARHESTSQTLAGLQEREVAISASVAELADKIADVHQKLNDPETEQRLATIARSAAELIGRESMDDAAQAIEEKLQSLEAGQRSALADLKAELLDAAVAAVNARLEASEKRLAEMIEGMRAQPAPLPAPATPFHEAARTTEFDAPPFVGSPPFAPPPVERHAEVPPLQSETTVFPFSHDNHQSARAGLLEPTTDVIESAPSISEQDLPSPHSFISAARRSAQANAAQDTAASTGGQIDGLLGKWRSTKPQNKLIAGIAAVALVVAATHLWLQRSFTQSSTAAPALDSTHKVASSVHVTKPIHPKLVAAAQPALPVLQHVDSPVVGSQPAQAQKPEAASTQPDADARIAALAEAGNTRAALILGLRAFGDKENPASAAEAAKWLSRAANQGDAIAQYHLGMLYQRGRGVSANTAKAFELYEAAANAGNRDAMNNLGVAYAQGSGTAKDLPEAVRWFSAAAKLGLVEAQFDLAVLYERGEGVPQSLANAYRWYLIAAKEGDEGSKARADALATQISVQDRAAADQFAAEFKPEPIDPQANIAPPLWHTEKD